MTDEHARLLALQQQFEKEDNSVAFVGQSVNETIKNCVLNGMTKRADKVKSDFKVPDSRYVLITINLRRPPERYPGSGISSCMHLLR